MAGLTVDGLVAAAVALVWLSVAGVWRMRAPLDRLHFATPVATLAPAAAGLAAVVHDAGISAAIKPLTVIVVTLACAPVATHALGAALDGRKRR